MEDFWDLSIDELIQLEATLSPTSQDYGKKLL